MELTSSVISYNINLKGRAMISHAKRRSMTIIISLLVFVMTSAVYAQDGDYIKEGWYVGVFSTQVLMSGDFNGSGGYDDMGELLAVPDIANDTGLGFVFGAKGSGVAFELGFQRSDHKTSSLLLQPVYTSEGPVLFEGGETSYNVIDLNLKIDVFPQKQFRPYILLGLGYSWITIENGLFDYTEDLWSVEPGDEDELKGSFEDTTYGAFNVNLGFGVAYYFHPQWAITAGVIHRWNRFEPWDIFLDDALTENTFTVNVGITYTF